MNQLRCLAVDDEPLALELLCDNISKLSFLQLSGTCANGIEVLTRIQQEPVDLIFLDIQMPGLNGLQLAGNLLGKTMIIFLSAFEEHALDGFNVNAVDYLVKPVSFDRFLQASLKALELWSLRQGKPVESFTLPAVAVALPKFIYVHVEYNLVKIEIEDILFIEGFKDYVKMHLKNVRHPVITRMSMKLLEEKLAVHDFIRAHKSYIVPLARISSIGRNHLMIAGLEVPLSEHYKDPLMERIGRLNIL